MRSIFLPLVKNLLQTQVLRILAQFCEELSLRLKYSMYLANLLFYS